MPTMLGSWQGVEAAQICVGLPTSPVMGHAHANEGTSVAKSENSESRTARERETDRISLKV